MRYRLLIIAATIIWGSSFVIVKDITSYLSVGWLLVLRFIPATIVMALVFARYRRLFFTRDHIIPGCVIGLALFCAYYLQTIGITDTTPGKNAFLTGVYCVLVPFVAWALMRKRPNRYNIAAAVLCLGGIGLISLDGDLGMRFGDAMTLGGAVFYALQITLMAKYAEGRNVYVLTMWQFATVGTCSLVTALATEPVPEFSALPASALPAFAYLAVVVTAVAILFQNIGQAHLPPASAALLLSLEAVFGAAFSVALGYEELTARVVAGFAVVFAAIVVSEVLPERKSGVLNP